MEQITSKENARIKRLVKLRDSKSERDESGLFLAEGLRLCMDASLSGIAVLEIYATRRALDKHPKLNGLLQSVGESFLIEEDIAAKISGTKTPQGIFMLCEQRGHSGFLPKETGKYLLLASLQDPGNVGTIIRTAEALGLDGLIMSADCPDLYSPKVLRATMGGAFRLPVAVVPDMKEEILRLKSRHIPVYAAALRGDAENARDVCFKGGCAVLIGNEGAGLPEELIASCDRAVMIPMAGGADSLSAPVAAGILLWEMTKHR